MSKTSKSAPSADEIAEKASRGEDISKYFTNKFTVVRPLHRVNVDLTHGMLRELDERAARLNVSRQAVIKTLLRQPVGVEEEGRLAVSLLLPLAPRGRRRFLAQTVDRPFLEHPQCLRHGALEL